VNGLASVNVSNTSGGTLVGKGKSDSAGIVTVTEGTESLMVVGGREDADRGRRSAESLFLARLVPDSAVVSDVAGTERSELGTFRREFHVPLQHLLVRDG
jgi:hypothetical protein